MKKLLWITGLVIIVGVGCFLFISPASDIAPADDMDSASREIKEENADLSDKAAGNAESEAGNDEEAVESAEEEQEELTEEEKKERADEKLVDEFDAETDRWMDAEKTKPPTMKEIDAFHAKFKALPKARKDECLHRALNLIPDENVMLLVGILMDKSEDKEMVEMIYNDVLNRDESVKKPILQTIFKDKEHPCWTDTAWILDVTGELPKKN